MPDSSLLSAVLPSVGGHVNAMSNPSQYCDCPYYCTTGEAISLLSPDCFVADAPHDDILLNLSLVPPGSFAFSVPLAGPAAKRDYTQGSAHGRGMADI